MATFSVVHQGLAYGDGVMSGAGSCGQAVKLSGNDTFVVNTDPTAQSAGFLKKDCADGAMPTVMMGGGVFETDVCEAGIVAGNNLAVHSTGKLHVAAGGEVIVGRALSMSGGVLKFVSLV